MTIKCEDKKQLRDVLDRLDADGIYEWASGTSIKDFTPSMARYPICLFLYSDAHVITFGSEDDVKEDDKVISAEYFCTVEPDTDNDPVNHPSHYTQGKVECIDAMEMVFGKDAVSAYCMCAMFKYMWRRKDKGNEEQDKAKAEWYWNKFMEIINR